MEIENLLTTVAKLLDNLDTPYIITGGMAVSMWGRTRTTLDIDIIVELLPKNIGQLAKGLMDVEKDGYVSEYAIKEALERKGEFNFIDPTSGYKVDFWIVKDAFNKQELARAISMDIDGQKVKFISPEDLILSKLLWHKESYSTKQCEDIKSVLDISYVDMDYVKQWAEKQGTLEILNGLLEKQ